jgi:hypothetical protein
MLLTQNEELLIWALDKPGRYQISEELIIEILQPKTVILNENWKVRISPHRGNEGFPDPVIGSPRTGTMVLKESNDGTESPTMPTKEST